MERTTRKHLEHKIETLKRMGLEDISLDHMQPGDAKYVWAVENKSGSRRLYSRRMTTVECYAFLEGLIIGAEMQGATRSA